MGIVEIEKYLVNYKFSDGVSKFKIINRFDDCSIFIVENKLGGDFSGKITSDCLEFYGCGDDKFYDATKDGVLDMISQIEEELANCVRFEFFNKLDEMVFVIQSLITNDLNDVEINKFIDIAKNEIGEIWKVKITSSKLKEPIVVDLK